MTKAELAEAHDILATLNYAHELQMERHWRRYYSLFVRKRRPDIPKRIRLAVFARDGYRCRSCGSEESLQIDHVRPWSRGGAHTKKNMQTLCGWCNRSKGASC